MTPSRLFDFITYQKDNAPLEKSFTTKYDGKWESISSEMFCEQAESISNALIELGIEPQDKQKDQAHGKEPHVRCGLCDANGNPVTFGQSVGQHLGEPLAQRFNLDPEPPD